MVYYNINIWVKSWAFPTRGDTHLKINLTVFLLSLGFLSDRGERKIKTVSMPFILRNKVFFGKWVGTVEREQRKRIVIV